MKIISLCFALVLTGAVMGQDPVATANKCYDEKNYTCAADNYKKAIADKKFAEKDRAVILMRIGYSLKQTGYLDDAVQYLKDAIVAKPDLGDAYWTLGGTYYAAEEYMAASENYGKAIELFANDPASLKSLYYWRGKSYSGMEKYEDAMTYFDMAIKKDSTVGSYYSASGDASYNMKKFDDAVTYYKKAIQFTKPDDVDRAYRHYWLGQSYLSLKKYDDALAAYTTTLQIEPKHGDAQWGVAGVYYSRQKWNEAIAAYTQTIGLFKNDTLSLTDLYYFRGRAYRGAKDYAKANADQETALKLNPLYKGAVWEKASIARDQKKHKEAIALYTKAIEVYKKENNSLDDLYYFRGNASLQLKDTTGAIADFKESLKYNYNLLEPNILLGHIYFTRKAYADAKPYYSRVIESYKTDSAEMSLAWFRKGYAGYVTGVSLYTCKEDFLKSIRYDSTNREAHRYLGDLYYSQQSYALTEKEMDKCLVLYKGVKDSLPRLYIYRGAARSAQKKYKDALSDYEQSDKLNKFKDPAYIVTMGQLAFETKEYDKVSTYFTRIIPLYKPEQKSELMFAYFGRGRANLELRKKAFAVADLKKALEFAPGNKEVEGWLAKAQAL